jgi:hypothetical protein
MQRNRRRKSHAWAPLRGKQNNFYLIIENQPINTVGPDKDHYFKLFEREVQ